MRLRVTKPEYIEKFNCPTCESPLKQGTFIISNTGMIECQNTTGAFNAPCLSSFSFTYCRGCNTVALTKGMKIIGRLLRGMTTKTRFHVCNHGKLSPDLFRLIPHTDQVRLVDGDIIIRPPIDYNSVEVMDELVATWEREGKFTPEMIGEGEVDTINLTNIPRAFWKMSEDYAPPFVSGHSEHLRDPYCPRCNVDVIPSYDNSLQIDYQPTHVCPCCGACFTVIDAGGQEPHSGTTNAPLPQG